MTQLVPYAFADQAGPIPLSELDANFAYVSGKLVSVKDSTFGAKGDNATTDYTAFSNALAYVGGFGGVLYVPHGSYYLGAGPSLVIPNGVTVIGEGVTSILRYGGVLDAVQSNNPINTSTDANINLQSLWIKSDVATSGKACYADTGGTYLNFTRCKFSGADRLLILDQSELVNVNACQFELGSVSDIGVWLVNGPTRTPMASLLFTNRINIEQNNQFNGTQGVGIADDGGASHRVVGNNFNSMEKHVRATWCYGIAFEDNESEEASVTHLDFPLDRFDGGSATEPCSHVTIGKNFFSTAAAINFITLTTDSILHLTHYDNHCNGNNVGSAIWGNLAAGANECVGFNTFQFGSGDPEGGNTINTFGTYTPAWASSSNPQPSIGDGSLAGSWIRNGTEVTVTVRLVIGASTTLGTGEWQFGLPLANFSAIQSIGSVQGACAGVFAVGSCKVLTVDTVIELFAHGAGVPFGPAQPGAWAPGDYVISTITYQVGDNWLPTP